MKRVYLSGPMSGRPEFNFPAFHAAAKELRAKGLDVANPAEIEPTGEKTWANCMRADIKALCDCCTVALLPGWEDSKGANIEARLAIQLGMRVVEIETLLAEAECKFVHELHGRRAEPDGDGRLVVTISPMLVDSPQPSLI